MSWMDTCSPISARTSVLGELDAVRGHLSEAVHALRVALTAEWYSAPAEEYVALVEELLGRLRRLSPRVDALEGPLGLAQRTREEVTGSPW